MRQHRDPPAFRQAAMLEPLEARRMLSAGPRQMEYLGRGVIATRASSSQVFVSWRSMALDQAGMGFNVYRSANGGAATKLNASPLTLGTNYTDTTANVAASNAYFVTPVIGGVEQPASGAYTLPANTAVQPLFSIPLRNIGDYYVHLTWVGDLDGDGEYDFVVDRLPNQPGMTQKIEGYRRDGTFLWSVDFGPNSLNQDNIEPGSSAISVGNWDGVNVYDLDGDGKAEVFIRSSNGVVFGDGTTLSNPSNNNIQFISVLNGMTGAERARVQVPTDYIADGPMASSMGVGYLDGVHPSLVSKMKNRIGSGSFNLMVLAYDFNGTSITQKWQWKRGNSNAPDGHQIRIVDVDQNGTDEVVDIGYVLNGADGTVKYLMGPQGIMHGDRTQIGDLDPDRPGLEGYAIQQDNPSGLLEYYYDAATGQILHSRSLASGTADVGRGIAADIDPNYRGYEYWSFSGIFNSNTPVAGQPPVETQLTSEPNRPWPNFRIWWDGDVLSENLNETKVDKWVPASQTTTRLLSAYQYGATETWRGAPTFYGDIFGDWREEIVFEKYDHTSLQIFTTQTPSTTRIYTLAEDPEYRNCMTVKGYMQSNMVDYYLGSGMATPPTPNIQVLAPTTPVVLPPAPTGLNATAVTSSQVNLTWNAAAGASSYKIKRSTSNGGPYAVIGTSTGTSFSDTNLVPNGGTYYYAVTQVNAAAVESPPSNQVSITIGQPPTSNLYQAEIGVVGGGAAVATDHSGYNGTGFIDFPGTGGTLQLNNIDGGGGGTATFTIRFAMGAAGTRTGTVTINGVAQNITFASTGSWNSWTTIAVTATVSPGATNTLRLQSTGQDLGNIDQVQVDVPPPPFNYTGGSSADQYYVRRNGAAIEVWVGGNGTGLPTYSLIYNSTPSLSFSGGAGNDTLTIDLSNGNAMPTQGISFDGGSDTDTLAVVGSGGADAVIFNSASVVIGSTLTQTGIERRTLAGNGGIDNVTINAGSVALAGPLMTSALTVAAGATLDLGAFALMRDYADGESPLEALAALIASGRNGGGWNGTGIITSMSDAKSPSLLTTLAVAEAAQVLNLSGSQTAVWNGQTVDATTVLVKYTYAGDANLDGRINGDDYFLIDSHVNTPGANTYVHGDFDFNGIINGDDYFLIDSNINRQGLGVL